MFPHERSLVEEMKGKPFALIGVNSDDRERAQASVQKNNLNWRSFWAGPGRTRGPIPTAWGIQGWPTIVILDPEGVIRYRGHDGEEATAVAKALVDKAMAVGGK
ncbi:MAG: hypothetical protein RL398_1864 [Planctomycetota bacterium]|jgi:hypothetical protein